MPSTEIQRILLLVGLGICGYLLILAWNEDYGQPTAVVDRDAPSVVDTPGLTPVAPVEVDPGGDTDVPSEDLLRDATAVVEESGLGVDVTDELVTERLIEVATPALEVCNAVDDDCSGQTDDVLGLGRECSVTTALGTCTGVLDCITFGPPVCTAPLPAEERWGLLWVHPDPAGEMDLVSQLGALGPELDSWDLARHEYQGATTFDHAMNWKLAIDTFGETYHFNVLHRNTLAQDFHGNVQTYDTFGRHHRMGLCLRAIDDLRGKPKDEWHVLRGVLPVYYLFPNVQLIVGGAGPTLVRIYPDGANPHQSWSQVGFYNDPRALESPFVKAMAELPH